MAAGQVDRRVEVGALLVRHACNEAVDLLHVQSIAVELIEKDRVVGTPVTCAGGG